jgi:hypothetical protein
MDVKQQTNRRRLIKPLVWGILTPFSLYLLLTLLPWSVDLCSEENKGDEYSPNGKYLARIYERNCGATTGFHTHVNIRSKWDYFNTVWVGTITQGQVFSMACRTEVKLVWKDDNNLEIHYRSCEKIYKSQGIIMKNGACNNVTIHYVEMGSEGKN